MNNRIAEIRKINGISQGEMADRLGLTRNYISLVECGNRSPSERTISDICRIFNINEQWLRTGDGDMLKPINRDAAIAAFMGEVMKGEDADFRRRLIAVLSKLDTDEWELLEQMALKLAAECKKEDQA